MTSSWKTDLWLDAVAAESGDSTPARSWAALPAIGQLTLSRPELLRAFEIHNRRHPTQVVRPFNFVSVAYAKPLARAELPRLIAPFVGKPSAAPAAQWFDLRSGLEVRITSEHPLGKVYSRVVAVRSYGEIAHEHAARPELKFGAPDGGTCLRTTRGTLRRQRVLALWPEHLGKEGNLLDRRAEGADAADELQEVFEDEETWVQRMSPYLLACSSSTIAHVARISERAARELLAGRSTPRSGTRSLILTYLATRPPSG